MSTHDPETEAGAMALCWITCPTVLSGKLGEHAKHGKLAWWNAQSDRDRDLYRYRASVVLEAVDEMKGVQYAAE